MPAAATGVDFDLAITGISGSGLSRTVAAQITNLGTADAHNVWGKAEAFSDGSRIKLSGKEYLRVDVGTLKAGESTVKETTLSFSITDGLKIAQKGVLLELTVFSDEGTETFSYDYKL